MLCRDDKNLTLGIELTMRLAEALSDQSLIESYWILDAIVNQLLDNHATLKRST